MQLRQRTQKTIHTTEPSLPCRRKSAGVSLIISALIATTAPIALAATEGDIVVSPEARGTLIDKFFIDFKKDSNPDPSDKKLDRWFQKDGLNGLRTPIYGDGANPDKKTEGHPAHPKSGEVIAKYYAPHIQAILRAKKRNPNLIVFASKKLNGKASFPDWVKRNGRVAARPYANMLADYIEFMASQQIQIDVLGIDNERRYNEGKITPTIHKKVVDELRALADTRNFPMPRIIGPEDFDPNRKQNQLKVSWMQDLVNRGWSDRIDLYGTHYYPDKRIIKELQSDLALAGSIEKWHTELHWNTKVDEDKMLAAERGILAMWDCIDNGMNGLMWWAYSSYGFRGSLMREFSAPIIGAYALNVDDLDGPHTVPEGKLQTRAFLKRNQLTVYVINNNADNNYKNQIIRIDSGQIAGRVKVLQWTSVDQKSGAPHTLSPTSKQHFAFDIPPRSITSFRFTYTPPTL